MGAGASTEFNAEAVLADEGDPTEPMADEGYDSTSPGTSARSRTIAPDPSRSSPSSTPRAAA